MNTFKWNKETIRNGLELHDSWVKKGVLAIYSLQTATEQQSEDTLEANGVGFSGCDAMILSSFAKQLQDKGFLSPKQMVIARKKMLKYAKQLAGIANAKLPN